MKRDVRVYVTSTWDYRTDAVAAMDAIGAAGLLPVSTWPYSDPDESVLVCAKREADELRQCDVLLVLMPDPEQTELNSQMGHALVSGKRVVVVGTVCNNCLVSRRQVERVTTLEQAINLLIT